MKVSKREKRILAAAERARDAEEKVALEQATMDSFRIRTRELADQEREARKRLDDAREVSRVAYSDLYLLVIEGIDYGAAGFR